jgi:hypothetical protein
MIVCYSRIRPGVHKQLARRRGRGQPCRRVRHVTERERREVPFKDRGVRELKGIPGEWPLFAVARPESVRRRSDPRPI